MAESPLPVVIPSVPPPPLTVGRALRRGVAFALGIAALAVLVLLMTWWLMQAGGLHLS
jgi:hypothetical protein